MAAYAALVSLINSMEQIHNHPRHSISLERKQIESLCKNVGFLLGFLECYSHGGSKEAEALESQIASAAYAAEDVIESHVVDQTLAGSTLHGKTSPCFLVDLQKVIEEMDSIKKMAMKVKEERGFKDHLPTHSMPATSSKPLTTGKNTMVGFDDVLVQLMDTLTGHQSSRKIIRIVGMGGIGKTTLARNVYENLVVVQHFDIRAWVTISQEYSVKEILLKLLSRDRKDTNVTNEELGEQLYKKLSGRRYLIILDDMWNIEVWDNIKFFFPDNCNRSRIIVTSRHSNLANHFGSSCLAMNFLDEDKSWNLFCEKAFAQEGCPPELEEIGKKIVKKCRGLPLSIVVIGGHLAKSSRRQEYWENVASDINSILNSGEDEQCLNILSLSYSHLPIHLKPCFLYMGIFSEDDEIRVSQLIKLWVAEGFLKPNKAQSLEEVAEGYLKDLIDRNLVLVHRWSRNGKIKTCNIHDLLRELCLRVAEKEKFLCIMRVFDIPQAINMERRIVIHERTPEANYHPGVFHALKSAKLARSLICKGGQLSFNFRLLKVLNVVERVPDKVDVATLEANFQQVNLRYLDFRFFLLVLSDLQSLPPLYLPSSISLLWNLQTLIISGASEQIFAPSEIWEMLQLRHVEVDKFHLPDPPPRDRVDQQDGFVLRNLQTLSRVVNFRLSEEVCKRIPNIKKLHLSYNDSTWECWESSYYCPNNLGRFHKLESLRCSFTKNPSWRYFLLALTVSSSLQKLSLRSCFLDWRDLEMIGLLPNLEVLKLGPNSVQGPEWNPVEGGFLRLKFLKIEYSPDLIYWNANSSHFPVLEDLVLHRLYKLDEIPLGIGEIGTLRFIRLQYCSMSAAISAMNILEEQESLGNEGLRLEVQFGFKKDVEIFREKVELKGFTSNNLHLLPAPKFLPIC